MKMHLLNGGRLRMRRDVYYTDSAPEAMIELPVSCYLLEHPSGKVLFDTGCHPQLAIDPVRRIGGMTKMMSIVSPPSDNVVDSLRRIGVQPADIDLVVNSHLHTDHCGCNEYFKSAMMLCHCAELSAAQQVNAHRSGYFRVDWDNGGPTRTIDGQHDVFGDGRLVLYPVPGHTPGSIGALVSLDRSGVFFLASDAASVEENISAGAVPRNNWNTERFAQSLEEMHRMKARGVQILYGHDAAQWERLAVHAVLD